MNLNLLFSTNRLTLICYKRPWNRQLASIKKIFLYFGVETGGLHKSKFQAQMGVVSLRIYMH